MPLRKQASTKPKRRNQGFQRTGGLLVHHIREAGESRGFAETRLLTHWAEIVGDDIARVARPVKVGFGRQGFGATLTLLVTGANAPMVQMQLPRIRERVNATYGYAAISRVQVTQTAPSGFADAKVPYVAEPPALSETESARVARAVAPVSDETLKSALEQLGRNVLTKAKS